MNKSPIIAEAASDNGVVGSPESAFTPVSHLLSGHDLYVSSVLKCDSNFIHFLHLCLTDPPKESVH